MAGWAVAALAALAYLTPAQAERTAQPTAGEERYTVRAQVPELEVNTQRELRFHVYAADGYVLDRKYPAELVFVPEVGDEVLAAKKPSAAEHADEGESMSWTVAVTGKKAGKHPARANLKFRVCKADDCVTASSEIRVTIVVKDR